MLTEIEIEDQTERIFQTVQRSISRTQTIQLYRQTCFSLHWGESFSLYQCCALKSQKTITRYFDVNSRLANKARKLQIYRYFFCSTITSRTLHLQLHAISRGFQACRKCEFDLDKITSNNQIYPVIGFSSSGVFIHDRLVKSFNIHYKIWFIRKRKKILGCQTSISGHMYMSNKSLKRKLLYVYQYSNVSSAFHKQIFQSLPLLLTSYSNIMKIFQNLNLMSITL